MSLRVVLQAAAVFVLAISPVWAAGFEIATFQSDATPPVGSVLCGGARIPVVDVTDPLTARGVVFFPEGAKPIVLCAVDWVGIGNGGHQAWREALAEAAGTEASRVSVHVLHQHDAPMCDFSTEALLDAQGLGGSTMNVAHGRQAIADAATALRASLGDRKRITHVGAGEGIVERVASNRRILGADGRVRETRWTATLNPAVRAEPVGTIDPFCKSVSFWNNDTPVAVLTYYATHPQSHYGEGHVSADFPGMARAAREAALPGVAHIHFNGAGGNLGAGKWNDGAHENRPVLASRLEAGMRRAYEASAGARIPAESLELDWAVERVTLPTRVEIVREQEAAVLASKEAPAGQRAGAASKLAWIDRATMDTPIEICRLRIGGLQLIQMPGELFVEYQIAAQDMAPDTLVCMAAYADYGPGYIGTSIAYEQGGYEDGIDASLCGPAVEAVLMDAMRKLLQ
jgi:hypothetical protein